MLFDGDDEYYDDDDEYYDDDEYEEGEEGGGGAVVVILVALIVVLGAGAIAAAGWLLWGDGDDPSAPDTPEVAPEIVQEEAATPDLLDSGIEDLPDLEDPVEGDVDLDGLAALEGDLLDDEPAPEPVATRGQYREPQSGGERSLTSRSSAEPTRRSYDDSGSSSRGSSSDRSSSRGSSSGGSSSSGDSSTRRSSSGGSSTRSSSSGGSSSRSSSSGGSSSGGSSSGGSSSEGSSSGGSSSRSSSSSGVSSSGGSSGGSTSSGSSDTSSDPPPEEGAIIEDDAGGSGAASRELSYEADVLASMKNKAVAGSLSDDQVDFLEAVPDDNPRYTEVLAIAMRDAEAKRDFKRHCSITNRIVKKAENRYHPEWNLELAKCRLRNGDFEGSIDAVDRTLTDSMGMTSATKVRRLLLAYEIKAVCRTRIYDSHAKANSGMGDDAMLNNAIAAWTSYRNYAAGVGNGRATQKAEREIADLNVRKGT